MVLVDTSVWIEPFRARNQLDLTAVVDLDEVVTCLPVVQEVLQGFRDERAYRLARESMLSLPIVESPLGESMFIEAVALYRAARRAGVTIRSSTDCLIAACAIAHNLEVLHRDRDYPALARISALRQREA
jgi:predicted nucleic acid-binding protein